MRKRAAFTLIEMLVVITVGSAILTVCAMSITLLLRAEATGTRAIATDTIFARLSRQFRDDVHAAATANMAGDTSEAQTLAMMIPGGRTISFHAEGQTVVRTVQGARGPVSTNRYPLWHARASFEVADAGDMATLVIVREEPHVEQQANSGRTRRIEAALGRDQRLASSSGGSNTQ